jgi:hypothetical protein
MKCKALRTKKEPKEFIEIVNHGGTYVVYTHELPNPQPTTATMELMKAYYEQHSPLPAEINLDDYELVELDIIESGIVGADIRNKLTPLLNLIALCGIVLKDEHPEKREVILRLLRKEMETSKICIKYLTNLL